MTEYQSLTVDDDTDNFQTALLQIDGRCPIRFSGNPIGVVASGFSPVFGIDDTTGDLYYCSKADGTTGGTDWNLVSLSVFPASTSVSGITRYAASADFDDDSNSAAVTPFSLIGQYAKAGYNVDITSLNGLTTPLSAGQGGTGLTSIAALQTAVLPSQSGNAGYYLMTNGSGVSFSPLGAGSAPFIKSKVTASGNLAFGNSYDIDLASASANIALTLPSAALAANVVGKQIIVVFVSYSSSYYAQINTSLSQTYGGQVSGTISTQNLPSDNVINMAYIFEANTLGQYNVFKIGAA